MHLSRSALWTLWVGNRLLEAPVSGPHPSGHSRRLSGGPASSGVSPRLGRAWGGLQPLSRAADPWVLGYVHLSITLTRGRGKRPWRP